jgi:hypothetical protein
VRPVRQDRALNNREAISKPFENLAKGSYPVNFCRETLRG